MKINLKITLLRSLLALTLLCIPAIEATAGGSGSSYKGTGFTFRAKYSANPTGAGKVYGDFVSESNARSLKGENTATRHRLDDTDGAGENVNVYSPNDITLYLYAVANDGYRFVEWQDDKGHRLANSTPVDESGAKITDGTVTKYGKASVPKFKSTNVCARNVNTNDHTDQHANYPNLNTHVDSFYVAIFEKLVKDPVVTVDNTDNDLGVDFYSPSDNDYGDVVTLSAHPKGAADKGYENKFIGWKRNGDFVRDGNGNIIRDNPYSFTISQDNAGVYTAVYESGYKFHRIRNFVTNDYFTAIADDVTGTTITAFERALTNDFIMSASSLCNAGSIFEIDAYKNSDGSGRWVYDFIVQNKHTKEHYSLPTSYIRLNQDANYDAWSFSTNADQGQGLNLRVDEQGQLSVDAVTDGNRYLWIIECIDKDLITKENYFSVDPAELYQDAVDGWYYTTLRTSWNVKFLKTGDNGEENMKAYVVTGVDADGEMALQELSGDIIPKGLPVLLACKTMSTENNRMIPTNSAATNADKALTTILKNSVKFFPNQPVPEAAPSGQAYYALGTTSEGRVGFVTQVTNTATGLNGNRGYYLGPQAVVLPVNYEPVTLAELLENGDSKGRYEITDVSLVESVPNNEDNDDQLLICKDDNGRAQKDGAHYETGMIDYMAYSDAAGMAYSSYDESNWVMLRVPAKFAVTGDMLNKNLGNVKGRLTNKVNPEFLVEAAPEAKTTVTGYAPNLYIPSSFAGTQTSRVTGETYFFVTPKPMELARVKWAIWDGDEFTSPSAAGNEAELGGSFGVNQSYMKQAMTLEENVGYSMTAVIKVNEAGGSAASPRRAAPAAGYVAWPLQMQQDQQIITGVNQLVKPRQVAGVVYYDIAGQPASTPRRGLNIVVTRYSDGSSTAEKRIY